MGISRRQFTGSATLTLAAASGALGKAEAAAEPSQSAAAPAPIWTIGARPDVTLSITSQTMDLFGHPISAVVAGGTWPGQAIRYRKGDQFRVLVENRLDRPTTLHWHGLVVPTLEDGVPGISQAPIAPGDAVYYAFPLLQSGTYWYHSHVGLQEQQGLGGPLIIEDPDEPHAYDEDIGVVLNDVIDIPVEDVIPQIRAGKLKVSVTDPYNMADGTPFRIDVPYVGYMLNGRTPEAPWTRALKPGSRARLRLINASGSSFFRVAIDGLRLTVIAADGERVQPVTVDDLVIGTAQRYDVLVTLPGSGSHTLHAAALGASQQAIGVLHTTDAAPVANRQRPRFAGRTLRVTDLRAPSPTTLPAGPRRSFDVVLGGQMQKYLWTMNGHVWPEAFAAFGGDRPEETWYDIQPGDVVRFNMVNRTPMAHPMHLHGHVFRVLPDGIEHPDAAVRDTVVVGPRGSVSIEFLANNPGKWFFHCHNLWHLAVGMAQAVRYRV